MSAQLTMLGRTPTGNPELSQWFTPRKLAHRLVSWAGIRGRTVLEPSCGDGAFLEPLIMQGCCVHAYDIDPIMVNQLQGDPAWLTVECVDFLTVSPPNLDGDMLVECIGYDWVVMNPPYDGGQDRLHIAHALRFAPKVLVLIRTAGLHGLDAFSKIWSQFHVKHIGLMVSRPAFYLGGSVQDSPRHDSCAVIFDRDHTGPTTVEWLS